MKMHLEKLWDVVEDWEDDNGDDVEETVENLTNYKDLSTSKVEKRKTYYERDKKESELKLNHFSGQNVNKVKLYCQLCCGVWVHFRDFFQLKK